MPKLTWREWYYTNPNENLLLLSKEELAWYRLIVQYAP